MKMVTLCPGVRVSAKVYRTLDVPTHKIAKRKQRKAKKRAKKKGS